MRYHIDTAKQTVEIGRFSGGGSRQGLIGVLSKKGSGLAPAFAALDPADRACRQMLTVHRRPA